MVMSQRVILVVIFRRRA